MRRPTLSLALAALTVAGAIGPPAAVAAPADLPDLLPPAATTPEPSLPAPGLWPFGESFPRTSGVGRHDRGAVFWTDFLYDDNGPFSVTPTNESPGAPSFGGFRYPAPEAANNGADIFRTAIGATTTDTFWRVDWVTLLDPAVPIAAFAIDADADAATGTAAWGVNTFLRSPGIEHVLVVSGTGAWLVDPLTTVATPIADLGGEHLADEAARSFVVRLPRAAFEPSSTSAVRLAAGLADAEGDGFLQLTPEHGWLPGLPTAFNVTFRSNDAEPALNSFWRDLVQAQTLAGGDVSAFSLAVDWDDLLAGRSDPEPLVHGDSNRWYVSTREFGQGIVGTPESVRDDAANYLGRVQPYAVHVPTTYDGSAPVPLTWLLHSYVINHNQYLSTAPSFVQQACEDRGSICAMPLGRGPDGFYAAEAELDFWEVWRAVADGYRLDPERTVMGGYSMGGFGTIRFIENHPHLFAGAFLIAASPEGRYEGLENTRAIPYYHAHGAQDQLVQVNEAFDTIARLDELGHRYTFDLYPGEDHVAWSLKDNFGDAGEWLKAADLVRDRAPRDVIFGFDPAEVDDDLGIGPRGAYWLTTVIARDVAQRARVAATAASLPGDEVVLDRATTQRPDGQPSPAQRQTLAWTSPTALPVEPSVALDLGNVSVVVLDVAAAGLDVSASGAEVLVDTDGTAELRLDGLPAGTTVLVDGVAAAGAAAVLSSGSHRITFAAPSPAAQPAAESAELPATGGGLIPGAALMILGGLASKRRRG